MGWRWRAVVCAGMEAATCDASGAAPAGRTLSRVDAGVRAASGVRASILRRCPVRRAGASAGLRRTRATAILAYVPLTILVALASQSIPGGLGCLNVL